MEVSVFRMCQIIKNEVVSGRRGRWESKGSSVEDEDSIYAPSATGRHKIISLDVQGEKEMGHMSCCL